MKKLILKMSVSADGFVGGPKEESDWIFSTASRDSDKWDVATLWNASLHPDGKPDLPRYGGVVADGEKQVRAAHE